jgi:predicted RNA-binding protein Jag
MDMNDPKRRFFSGDSLQQALVQAANYFNLDPQEIAYRSIEKKHGFLKVRRKVVIEVDPDAPRREAPAPLPPASRTVPPPPPAEMLSREAAAPPEPEPSAESPAPDTSLRPAPAREERRSRRSGEERPRRGREGGRREGGRRSGDRRGDGRHDRRERREPGVYVPEARRAEGRAARAEGLVTLPEAPKRVADRFPAAEGPAAEAAATAAALLIRIAGLDLEPAVYQGEDRLEVDLSGADVDWCFADDGEFVLAVEHLLPRMIRTLSGEAVAVRVDCENFHEIREERLRSLAQRVAGEVRRKGRPWIMEPMNPADRRIIHVTLADDPGVVTESEGDGYFKRITVRPA